MARCFLVIGTLRSGTSLVAGVLHHLGIRMANQIDGKWNWPAPNDWNQAGFFQDLDFWKLLYKWTDAKQSQLAALIAERSSHGVDWGVKNHDLIYALAAFKAACQDKISVIRTTRDQASSIASWESRTKAPCPVAKVGKVLAKIQPDYEVSFDDLLNNPKKEVEQLAKFCGRVATPEAIAFPKSEFRRF